MADQDDFSAIGSFSTAQQPDEGYSEDPINPSAQSELVALSNSRFPPDLASWISSNISKMPISVKTELTLALLRELPTSVITDIVRRLNPRLYIDFIRYLPPEVCLKILGYLDPLSLASVMQTCRAWYELSLDRKVWEAAYLSEGWKIIAAEVEAAERKINARLSSSTRNIQRMKSPEGHTAKVRALLNEEDTEMTDSDGMPSRNDSQSTGNSIFGSPSSSFSSNKRALGPSGEVEEFDARSKAMRFTSAHRSPIHEGKQKEVDDRLSSSVPPILPSDSPVDSVRSTLWMWDHSTSCYRVNWKYLYNMRRRLETNWELGKYTTFQLPHPLYPEEGHHDCIYTVQFDKNYVVSGGRDRTMRIWNIHTRRLVRPPLAGHQGSVLCLQFDADPEEDILVSGSSDSNVYIWKFSTGEIIHRLTYAHRESVLNVRFDKRVLVTSSKDKTIKIFNRRALKPGEVGYSAKSPAVGPAIRSVKGYGLDPDPTQEMLINPPFSLIGRLDGHTAAVNAIQIRDDTIVSVSGDRTIKVWDWPRQVCTKSINAHGKGIACVEYDGRRIASGSSDWEICIFDAKTGLKVAQLRGHGHLVRTVQAGFGDLPFSEAEDEEEARAVDGAYYKAVENGEIDPDSEGDRRRLLSRANAGSSLPQDIQAVGAKLPPGGGGGRKYGRIVSGSYDQNIIIWRRDKEGVWKPAHHLRQEEAAAQAQRQAAAEASMSMAASGSSSSVTLHPSMRGPHSQPGSQDPFDGPLPNISQMSNGPELLLYNHDRNTSRSDATYREIIDQVIPAGAIALQQALMHHPRIIMQHAYLQAAIERESSPFARSQLRHIVATALLAAQNEQSALIGGSGSGSGSSNHHGSAHGGSSAAGPSSSVVADAGSSSTASQGSAGPSSTQARSSQPRSMGSQRQGSQSSTGGPSSVSQSAVHGAPPVPPPVIPHAARTSSQPPPSRSNSSQPQPHPAPQLPPVQPHAPTIPPHHHHHHHHHHPHISATENAPAWVFKLQFDARRIVCCSRAPVIVGWDFCNGDAELEEASKFFATVE